ncbi:MAG: radical SAM protein [Candidatus Odinarchaeota archaeon]
MGYKYVEEVIQDPKLGNMLPINFNPLKVCSFNCIFCDLGETTRLLMEREIFFPPEEILSEIEAYIVKSGKPDYIWLTGNGEPTLYLGFKQIVSQIMLNYPKVKIRVSTNGSLLHREEVRNELLLCDFITINLNTLNPKEYLKISRHHKDVKLENVIKGIRILREHFTGEFRIVTIYVKGINDNKKNVQMLKSFLSEINPNYYLIKVFSNNRNESLSEDFKNYVKESFKDVNFRIENKM